MTALPVSTAVDIPASEADRDITLDILVDRYEGAMNSDVDGASERWLTLQQAFEELVYIVSRRVGDIAWDAMRERGEGDLHVITDELHAKVRETVIRRVHELEVAG